MPNLIDFDKLMEQYDFYNEFTVHDLRYLKKEYLPFVEAIPVEWLQKKYDKWKDRDMLGWSYCVKLLIEDWEKENDNLER